MSSDRIFRDLQDSLRADFQEFKDTLRDGLHDIHESRRGRRYEGTSSTFRSWFDDDPGYHYQRGRSPSPVRFSSGSRRRRSPSPLVYEARYRSPSPARRRRRRSPSPGPRGASSPPRFSQGTGFYRQGGFYGPGNPGLNFSGPGYPGHGSSGPPPHDHPDPSRNGFYGPGFTGPGNSRRSNSGRGNSGPSHYHPDPSWTNHPNANTRERYHVSERDMRVYAETYRQLLERGWSREDAARALDQQIYEDMQH